MVNFKINLKVRQNLYSKFKFINALHAYQGLTYVHMLLQSIKLAKEIFVLNIEQGDEIFVPTELNFSNLPMSFQFYDPILQIIQHDISDERKEFFLLRNKMHLDTIKVDDKKSKLIKMLGLKPSSGTLAF